MPLPNDPAYYADCYELFDRALKSPHGVQRICMSESEARHHRNRLHMARVLSRELNKKVNPNNNSSEFYRIVVKIIFDGKRWLMRLEKRELKNEEIEDIMPVEIESEPEELKPGSFEVVDEFSLAEPERDLDPSPPGTDRVRRI